MTKVIPPKSIPNGFQTLHDAFDQFGRERFPDDWTGQEIVSYSGPRWAQALDAFVRELEAGRVVITNLQSNGTLFEVPNSYWRAWDADERLATYLAGNDVEADEYFYGPECPHYVRLPVVSDTKIKGMPGPGAPTKYEKDDLWKLFDKHCKLVGSPGKSNEKGWRTQADVQRWLVVQIEELEGERPDHRDGPVRRMARDFMAKWTET